MSHVGFSLRRLFLFIAFIALGFAGFTRPGALTSSACFTLALALPAWAFAMSRLRSGNRNFWVGASLLSGAYICIVYFPGFDVSVGNRLITTQLIGKIETYRYWTKNDIYDAPANVVLGADVPGFNDSDTQPRQYSYMQQAGHELVVVALIVGGGIVVQLLQRIEACMPRKPLRMAAPARAGIYGVPVIAVISTGALGLFVQNRWTASMCLTGAVLIVLLGAIALAVGTKSTFLTGMVVSGTAYLLLLYAPGINVQIGERINTTGALASLEALLFEDRYVVMYPTGERRPEEITPGGFDVGVGPVGLLVGERAPRQYGYFQQAGHAIVTVCLGCIGGWAYSSFRKKGRHLATA